MALRKKAPAFDLKKEARKAFRDFPQLRANTIFTSTDHYTTEYAKAPYTGCREVKTRPALDDLHDLIADYYSSNIGSGTLKYKKLKAVIIDLDEPMVLDTRHKDRTFAFDHEMGHFLIPGAYTDSGADIYDENAADAFAALRQIQRFGRNNSVSNLSLVSAHRSYQTMSENKYGTTHLTTLAVNQIIGDSKTVNFRKLSRAETIKAAEKYAKKYTPSEAEVKEIKKFSKTVAASAEGLTKKEYLELTASTALATSGRFSFQIGLSLFQPFLDPKGARLEGERIQFDSKTRRKFCEEFIERARHFGLEDIAAELEANKADMFTSKRKPHPSPRKIHKNGNSLL